LRLPESGRKIQGMRAVLLHVTEQELDRRRELGLDRWDEMWEGVLHMAPAPANEHQRILQELLLFLAPLLRKRKRGSLGLCVNVFGAENNYRIPDLSFVASGREKIVAVDGIRGAPNAVVEVRSPEDETYEKLPFFAKLGVREVIVVDRDSKKTEIFRLAGPQYVAVAADREGLLASEELGARFGLSEGKLTVEDATSPDESTQI